MKKFNKIKTKDSRVLSTRTNKKIFEKIKTAVILIASLIEVYLRKKL